VLGYATLVLVFAVAATALLMPVTASAGSLSLRHTSAPGTLPATAFVSAPPTGAKGPDDITALAVNGLDHGRALVWTAFQNGINPNGTPGTSGGPTQSTVAGYDPYSGALVRSINVTGKVDGLTANGPARTLIATVNEDVHSALVVIYPALGAVATYTYSPDPSVSGNGGTDSIAVVHGQVYLAHSNPNDTSQAAEYLVSLHASTLTAQLTPVFFDNNNARSAVNWALVHLALVDPDTNYVMPSAGERFAGELATISQADGEIVFAKLHVPGHDLQVLNVTDNRSGNVPPIDGMAVASCGDGTLYVIDAKAGSIQALDTQGWPKGTVFVGEPSDTGNPLVGTLNLWTGVITPLGNHFVSPKGLLFVPEGGNCA
jgi:hypothetical protein